MITGSVTLDGLHDQDLIDVLQARENSGGAFALDPSNMTALIHLQGGLPGAKEVYSGVRLTWRDKAGLVGLIPLLQHIANTP